MPASAVDCCRSNIERLFASRASVEEIYQACEADGSDFAKETLQLMRK